MLSSQPCSHVVLEKRVLAQAGTYTTVTNLMFFLRSSGYIFKDELEIRGSYSITAKGKKLLEALS